jgi:hypothetical protein
MTSLEPLLSVEGKSREEGVATANTAHGPHHQTWRRSLVVVTLLLVLGTIVVVAALHRNSQNKFTREECIAALRRAGVDVQFGVAKEKYNVFVFTPTFDDKQLGAIMPYVKGLEPLSFLTLCDTQISDASVSLLVRCRVDALHVVRTKITAKGAAELQRGLPNTWITHESIEH